MKGHKMLALILIGGGALVGAGTGGFLFFIVWKMAQL